MNDTQLQIVITAVNEASEQLQNVSAQLGEMADAASASAGEISDSFSDTGASIATDVTTGTAAATAAVAGMSDEVTEAATEMDTAFSGLNQKLLSIGIQAGLIGGVIAAPAIEAVKAASDQQDAFDQLGNTVTNVYASAGSATSGAATEIADLTAKINSEQSTIAEAQAALTKFSGTTAEVAAAHEKANTTIETAEVNIQKYQQELDNLTNSQSLAGTSAAQTTATFEAAARSATQFGFDASDSATALTYLFSSTQNVNETLEAFQDAMDLSAKLQIPVAQAANDVVQAMNGQGRALRDLGVNVADGLSGETALDAIQQKVAGSAALAATEGLGPMAVAQAKLNETLADIGTTVLPVLDAFFNDLSKIITAVDQWAEAHPKLAEALVIFIALLGGLLILLGAVLLLLSPIIIAIAAFGSAFVLAFIAIGIAIAAFVALIVVNWNTIKGDTEALITNLKAAWTDFQTWWQTLWTGIYTFLNNIWQQIQTVINSVLAAISKLTGSISGVMGGVTSGVSSLLTDVKAFAAGGIVNSPTLALVGEAGPEAIIPLSAFSGGSSLAGAGIGGGSGGINIYIQGGSYLDQGGAQQIAAALATQIGRQLKLKNFF